MCRRTRSSRLACDEPGILHGVHPSNHAAPLVACISLNTFPLVSHSCPYWSSTGGFTSASRTALAYECTRVMHTRIKLNVTSCAARRSR